MTALNIRSKGQHFTNNLQYLCTFSFPLGKWVFYLNIHFFKFLKDLSYIWLKPIYMIKTHNYNKYLSITFSTRHWPHLLLLQERFAQANCPQGICFDLENKELYCKSLARSEKNHYNNEEKNFKGTCWINSPEICQYHC